MHKDFSGVILAGGQSSRMGSPKPFISVNGKRIIDITLEALRSLFEEIFIVTNDKKAFAEFESVKLAEDLIKGCGPLGGIYTGLKSISNPKAFFVACDMPFLHNGMIDRQLSYFNGSNCDCCVPRIGGFIEPLHAVYKKNLIDDLEYLLKSNSCYSVRSFLQKADVCYWDLEDNVFNKKTFRNVNTLKDLERVAKNEGEV